MDLSGKNYTSVGFAEKFGLTKQAEDIMGDEDWRNMGDDVHLIRNLIELLEKHPYYTVTVNSESEINVEHADGEDLFTLEVLE